MKKTRRIYNELGLQLRSKHPKRRVKAKLRADRQEAVGPNEVWAMDFVHDQLATGRKLRILTVVDTHSRYCPAADPRFAYRGEDVVQTLERVCRQVGYPQTIRVDNGTEFLSRDLDLWAYANDVTLDFSRPGKPTDNGFIEAFNSKLRSECLNAHWFMDLACSAPGELDRLKLEFSATLSWLGEELRTMKASKFSDAQKAFVLKQGEEGTPVAEICRKTGISPATYFSWKKKYAGLLPDEMRRLKALEDENGRLKKIVADLTLDREMLQDVIRRKI
jgi:transposase InsO family protein